jgi:hypothetical protein
LQISRFHTAAPNVGKRVKPPGSGVRAGRSGNRRILPVLVGGGERLSTEPTTAVFTAGNGTGTPRPAIVDLLLGKPPEGELDGGKVTKVARVTARFAKSLASRWLSPNQEKVRLTTQGRGRTTKPFMSSLRLTISMRSKGTLPSQRQPAMRCSHHRPRSVRARGAAGGSCRAPNRPRLRSWIASAALRRRPGRRFCGGSLACRRRSPPGCLGRPRAI